jgi:hypothetical protein
VEAISPNVTVHTDTEARIAGQSVQANKVDSSPLNMFKVAAIVQQIMTELAGAVTEEQKISHN